jgi:Tol biopolymer transport system component
MPLSPGTRLGAYDIVGALGAGGMGEVYRARDTKLGRDVALKLLPDLFAADPDRLARFRREAQVLASLNHPHIAQIYGLEESSAGSALVMELVDGQTLADRLAKGPIPLDDTIAIAYQIAEALEAAHEKGIVHRDLKPGNIMVTDAGVVKVLDFGLAGFTPGHESSEIDITQSPTLTIAATRAGVIMGTAAYMSPEQAAGKAVDKRGDIWSFGVVLWEMLTGKRLFDGETISHTLADVLRAPIDVNQLPPDTPAPIRDLVRRCLDRDPRARLRDIGEARVAIQEYRANPAPSTMGVAGAPAPPLRTARTLAIAWSVAGAALVAAAIIAFLHFREQPPETIPVRFQIPPPTQSAFLNGAVLSPDGRMVAFEAPGPDGRPMLWVQPLDSLEPRPLAGTESAVAGPFWSPDSRHLGFGTSGVPRRLKRVDVSGGAPQTLADFVGFYREGAWNAAGEIVYGEAGTGLWRVRAAGGSPVKVTTLDPKRQEVQHAEPVFLPDGRHFLYHRTARGPEHNGIFLGSLDVAPGEQSSERLLTSDSGPVYVREGNGGLILFLLDGTLLAQPVDGDARVDGDPIRIADNVGGIGSHGWFSASQNGRLVYRTGNEGGQTSELVWFDRAGKRIGQVGPRGTYSNFVQLSPDGRHLLTVRAENAAPGRQTLSPDGRQLVTGTPGSRLWVADVARGVFGRLLREEASETSPTISANGRVAYTSTLNGALGDLYLASVTGVGTPEPLLLKSPTIKHPNDFSPDGRFLIYDDHTAQRQDLYVLPIDAPARGDRAPIPFVVTAADETLGQFSPDGRWIAYSTDESGRREVLVQGFAADRVPAAAVGKWIISSEGGDKPRWSSDGRELYYIAPDRKLMAVRVTSGATFEPGVAVPLFELPIVAGFMPYDVARDGRFLVNVVGDVDTRRSTPLTVVLDWRAALR